MNGDTHANNLPMGGPPALGGRNGLVAGVGGGSALPEALPEEPARYLKEVLEPSALQTYRDLLLDPDPKVRRQAASDIMEMRGMKGKVAPSLGGLTFNLAPGKMAGLLEGLGRVFRPPEDVIDVG